MNGIGMGLFTAPNSAGVMNSLPPAQRGAGAGMLATFTSSAAVLSIGVFFSPDDRRALVGAAARRCTTGSSPTACRRPTPPASRTCRPSRRCSRRSSATTRSKNAARPACARRRCRRPDSQALTGRSFFPHLISGPFHTALVYAFTFAIVACLVAAVASLLRGGKYHYEEKPAPAPAAGPAEAVDARDGRDRRRAPTGSARSPSWSA